MQSSEQLCLTQPAIVSQPLSEAVCVFASGMNRVTDIRAAAAARVPLGVDVSRLSQKAIAEVIESGLPVLLDSGAFSEVAIRNGQICVRREITDSEWERRLRIYLQIAKGLRQSRKTTWPKVSAIAPDRIGSQEITIARLKKFKRQIEEIHALGADILVPLQRGELDAVQFYQAARDALGIDIVPAFPMNKAAATVRAILEFLSNSSVSRIHLLGIGANNRTLPVLVRLLLHSHPGLYISTDANKIRSLVGANRPVTLNESTYSDELQSHWSGEIDLRPWGGGLHDMTECLFRPSSWLEPGAIHRVAQSLTWLSEEDRRAFIRDPDHFVNAEENQSDWLYQALTEAYVSWVKPQCRASARTRALFEGFSSSNIAYQVD